MGKRVRLAAVAGVIGLAMVAAACSNDDGGGGSSSGRGGGGGELSGDIVVSGSSTVEPITSLVGEEFSAENPNVAISVDGPGTGDGFELFCNGETDISDASRPIEPDEAKACKKNGITYTELKIGLDGITVMTNPANDAVDCLDFKDLYALVGPESEGFETWSDADKLGQEIGAGHVPYPNAPLDITAPGEESGTYDTFIELAGFEDIGVERGLSEDEAATTRPDYQSSPNDNVIIQGIEGSDSSFGWVGFAYFEENSGQVKAVQIDGGDGCVGPSRDTIADGSYPMSRPLFIYVNNEKASTNEAVSAFVDFYMTDAGIKEGVTQAGYVDLPEDQIQQTVDTWEQASM
jgi:phosphate transport system substrate-binding protein